MPKYKFRWSNLPCKLLDELREALIEGDGESAELLDELYGARPRDDFVREAWSVLLDSWLEHDKESRNAVVIALRQARGEDGTITNRRGQLEYLRGLRNTKNLRSVVLHEFIDFGELERAKEELKTIPVEEPPPQVPTEVIKPPAQPPGDKVTTTTDAPTTDATAGCPPFTAAPGSIVIVRDEEWLVTSVEHATDGYFVNVVGLSELVRDTEATFSTALDNIVEADPTKVTVVADDSPKFRRSRLWLEAMLRKTPIAIADPGLTIAQRGLADRLEYQLKAVRKALDPDKLRPRILLADAVGLGKTLEIGMILSELVRRGRGDRILIVTPKHVLEQMQMELWTRFALPFVRLDSTGIQRIRQVLPANRNPFTYYKRVIISIDTLKSDRYIAHLRKQRWDAVVIDESHNVTNTASLNNRSRGCCEDRCTDPRLRHATQRTGGVLRRTRPHARPQRGQPHGELDLDQVGKLVIRRHRHHPDVAGEVGVRLGRAAATRRM